MTANTHTHRHAAPADPACYSDSSENDSTKPLPMDITESISKQLHAAHTSELTGLADEADAGILTAMRSLKRLREYRTNVGIDLEPKRDIDYGTVAVLMIELERLVNPKLSH